VTNASDDPGPTDVAVRLAVAAKRFRSRLREEAGLATLGLSELQLAILIRLRDSGPSTAAALAEAEHVSQQAIAQCLTALKSENLVSASTDPNDRRKVLTSLSANGGELLNSIRTSRDTWLNRAIDAAVAPTEQDDLHTMVELLERLADIDLTSSRPPQSPTAGTAADQRSHTATEGDNTK